MFLKHLHHNKAFWCPIEEELSWVLSLLSAIIPGYFLVMYFSRVTYSGFLILRLFSKSKLNNTKSVILIQIIILNFQ